MEFTLDFSTHRGAFAGLFSHPGLYSLMMNVRLDIVNWVRRTRSIRRHGLEVLSAGIVLIGLFGYMVPRFLHQQLSSRFIVDSCNDLDEWTVHTGQWTVESGRFVVRPNPDEGTNWVMVYKQPVDPALLQYPITIRYDIQLLEPPDPNCSIWIGLGFGVPKASETHLQRNPLTPALAAAVRIEKAEFQGPLLYSRSAGWLGQYWEQKPLVAAFRLSSTIPGVPRPSPTASKEHFNPRSGYRIEGHISSIDFQSGGGVTYDGIASPLSSVHLPLGIVQPLYVECFDSPSTGLVLFVFQKGKPIPIALDNLRVVSDSQ